MSDANDLSNAPDAGDENASNETGAPASTGQTTAAPQKRSRASMLILIAFLVALLIGYAVNPQACSAAFASILYHVGLVGVSYDASDDIDAPMVVPDDADDGTSSGGPPAALAPPPKNPGDKISPKARKARKRSRKSKDSPPGTQKEQTNGKQQDAASGQQPNDDSPK